MKNNLLKNALTVNNALISLFFLVLVISSCSEKKSKENSASKEKFSTDIIKSNNTLNQDSTNGEYAVMTFEISEFDFGVIHEGDVVEYEFEFNNTGTIPLVINDTQVSCGCTVAEFPEYPIEPGEGGIIKVKFDSSGKSSGPQKRNIYITANTEPNRTQVSLTGEII